MFSKSLQVNELRTINGRFYAEFFGSRFFSATYVWAIQAHKYKLPHVSLRSILEDLEIEIDMEIDLESEIDKKIDIDKEIVHTKVR